VARKTQEFIINIHLPEDSENFTYLYTEFLYQIASKTMKKLPPDGQTAYAEKYVKAFCSDDMQKNL